LFRLLLFDQLTGVGQGYGSESDDLRRPCLLRHTCQNAKMVPVMIGAIVLSGKVTTFFL
jgi:hypothetical protein